MDLIYYLFIGRYHREADWFWWHQFGGISDY